MPHNPRFKKFLIPEMTFSIIQGHRTETTNVIR